MRWRIKVLTHTPPPGEYSLEIGIFSEDKKHGYRVSIFGDEMGYVEKSHIIQGLQTLLANFNQPTPLDVLQNDA